MVGFYDGSCITVLLTSYAADIQSPNGTQRYSTPPASSISEPSLHTSTTEKESLGEGGEELEDNEDIDGDSAAEESGYYEESEGEEGVPEGFAEHLITSHDDLADL